MARQQYDLILEAVHYRADGEIDWVRGYERRGAAFSDRLVWSRDQLLERLRAGQRVLTGARKAYWGNSFEIGKPVRLVNGNITTRAQATRDDLEDLPRL